MRSFFGGLVLALALAAPSLAHAQTQDARSAVAEALFAYSGTNAAVERAYDSRLVARQREIAALRTRARQSGAQQSALQAELLAVQERFASELAARDRTYAREIEVFRGAVTDIAADPAGLAALTRFNTGDELGALAALDQLRTARAAARQARNDIESAEEARRIATLALEARARGRVETAAVIARFEEVTRLDQTYYWDWVELARLYRAAVRPAEARRAVARATQTAQDERDRAIAYGEESAMYISDQDYAGALRTAEAGLAIWRRLAESGDAGHLRNLSFGLQDVGVALSYRGNAMIVATGSANQTSPEAAALLAQGLGYLQDSLRVRQQISTRDPGSARAQIDVADAYQLISFVYGVQRNLAAAAQASEQALAIMRRLATADPTSTALQLGQANALVRLGSIVSNQGDSRGARARYEEALAIERRLAAADPSSITLQTTVFAHMQWIGHALVAERNWPEALRWYEQGIAYAEGVAAQRPDIAYVHAYLVLAYEWVAGNYGVVQGDWARSRVYFERAVAAARAQAAAAPNDIEAQNAVWRSLFRYRSNYRGEGGTTWAIVLAEMEVLQRRGMLRELNSGTIAAARQNAAQEARP